LRISQSKDKETRLVRNTSLCTRFIKYIVSSNDSLPRFFWHGTNRYNNSQHVN